MHSMCALGPAHTRREMKSSISRDTVTAATGNSELPNVGPEKQTLILHWNSKHS